MKLRSFHTRSPTKRLASSVMDSTSSRLNSGNERRSRAAVMRPVEAQPLRDELVERGPGAGIVQHAASDAFHIVAAVQVRRAAAQRSSASSGIVFHRE